MANQKFAREFAKLNPQQKEAVETIEGPVMVLAGPGTGKTQVVALRVAQILSKTQANPRNVLALTFTEAGVTALRQRLIDVIGPDAYQVAVGTFHGFANEIISTFPYAFELSSTTSNLDQLDQYQILDQIIQETPKLYLLRPPRIPTFHVPAIVSALKTLKQEAVSPEQLEKMSAQVSKESNSTKSGTEAAKRQEGILKELATVYRQYQKYLLDHQIYDYEDMILLVLEALKSQPEVKQYLQERYQYILVDEYQDTNNAQNALVEALADFFDQPNLCVVGDDKQAIYRFQGASVANMLYFARKYEDIKIISLKKNYRNPRSVLETAQQLVSHNHQQLSNYLKIDTTLEATSRSLQKPQLIDFASPEAEYGGIVEYVQKLIKSGLPASQIAVLFRSNREVQQFRAVAESLSLAVAGTQSLDLLIEPEVKAILSILGAVSEPTNSFRVLAALPYLDSEVTPIELSSALQDKNNQKVLIDKLAMQKQVASVARAANRLKELVVKQKSLKLLEIVYEIIGLCCLTNVQDGLKHLDRLEIIHALLDVVTQQLARQPDLRAKNLLEYIDLMKSYKVNIPVRRASPEMEGVFASTVHGAKGLEFNTVVMGNVSNDGWKLRSSRSVIKLPTQIVNLKNWQEDQLEDERRLFYVGLTRAKENLVLTLSRKRADGSDALPSQFVTEIDDQLDRQQVTLSSVAATKLLTNLLKPAPVKLLNSNQRAYVKEKILNSPFSYTHFHNYMTCPRQYLLHNVLRIPEPPNFALGYGSAMHKALESYFKRYVQTKNKPGKDYLITSFKEAIERELSGDELRETKRKGAELLNNYYEKKSASWLMPVGVEYNFYTHHVEMDGIWLTGKFDRIDPIDPVARTVRVIDYKTSSRPKTRGQIEGTTQDSDGEIKQQLVFYALLAKHDRAFPFNVRELVVSFIDDSGKFTDETFSITAEEINQLEKRVAATYKEILSRQDFPHLGESFERGCELCGLF